MKPKIFSFYIWYIFVASMCLPKIFVEYKRGKWWFCIEELGKHHVKHSIRVNTQCDET